MENLNRKVIFNIILWGVLFCAFFFYLYKEDYSLDKQSGINLCREEGFIPDRIPLNCYSSHCSLNLSREYYWGNGEKMEGIFIFYRGTAVGENVNYYYGDMRYFQEGGNNSGGTILPPKSFTVNLVLDSKDLTNEGYKVKEFTCER
jgi:hypothetical protein